MTSRLAAAAIFSSTIVALAVVGCLVVGLATGTSTRVPGTLDVVVTDTPELSAFEIGLGPGLVVAFVILTIAGAALARPSRP